MLQEGFDASLRQFVGNYTHRHYLELLFVLGRVDFLPRILGLLPLNESSIFALDHLRFDTPGLLFNDSSSRRVWIFGQQDDASVDFDILAGQMAFDSLVLDSKVFHALRQVEAVEFGQNAGRWMGEFSDVAHPREGSLQSG